MFYLFVGGIALGDYWYEIVLGKFFESFTLVYAVFLIPILVSTSSFVPAVCFCVCAGIYLILGCACKKMFLESRMFAFFFCMPLLHTSV
jgi:hypothetical protein